MKQFKIGDEVKIIWNGNKDTPSWAVGLIGIITVAIDFEQLPMLMDKCCMRVKFPERSGDGAFYVCELEGVNFFKKTDYELVG